MSSWNPWDAAPPATNVSGSGAPVSSPTSTTAPPATTNEVFFDPFGGFNTSLESVAPVNPPSLTQPVVQPQPVTQPPPQPAYSTYQQPPAASYAQPGYGAPQPTYPPTSTQLATQVPYSGAPQQPVPTNTIQMFSDLPPTTTPPPVMGQPQPYPNPSQPAPMTSITFSNDFMDLLAATPSNAAQDTQLQGVTTALDDFFGTPAPAQVSATSTTGATTGQAASTSTTDVAAPPVSSAQADSGSTSTSAAPKRSTTVTKGGMTKEEKEAEDELLRAFEMKGNLDKLSQGLLGESWKVKWVTFKANRFAYYELKTDPRPKYYVYLDETVVSLPTSMAQSYDYHHAFQLTNERKGVSWYFRTGGTAELKRWTQAFDASIKHFKERNAETTIYERFLTMCCVRYRSVEQYRSFHFYTSKQSTGSYAIAACILTELLVRRCIDITVHENVILHADARYQGIGVLDDTLELLAQKLRMQRDFRLSEFVPMLLSSGTFSFTELSLDAPVLRCIDSAVSRGTLRRGQSAKDWLIANTQLEDDLIRTFHSLSKTPYEGTDVREHLTLGIAYTIMRALSKTDLVTQEVLDRGKVFPDLRSRSQVESTLDSMTKNLGFFDKKQTIVLKTIYSQLVQFITGGVQPQAR